MFLAEDTFTLVSHGVNTTVNLGVIVVLLKVGRPFLREYKVYTRMKERLNQLWRRRCMAVGDEFVPL